MWCDVNHRIINWVLITYIEEKKGPRHLLINSKKKNIDVWILKLNTLIYYTEVTFENLQGRDLPKFKCNQLGIDFRY